METFGQSYGYILYRTSLTGPIKGDLVVKDVRDYAQVYVNGVFAGALDRRLGQDTLAIESTAARAGLDILVENSGRVNFQKVLREERKGITSSVSLGGTALRGWDVFTLPMSSTPHPSYGSNALDGPAFYQGTFTLKATGDTFLDLRGWGKGTVWVNGHHLGRFWSIGPQQTLYVPGPWLKKGTNEVVVFDLERPTRTTMSGLSKPVLDQAAPPR